MENRAELALPEHLFSFLLDGVPALETPFERRVTEAGDTRTAVYDFPGGLRLTNTLTRHAFGAVEWVNRLENTGTAPTGVLSELWDCDVSLPMPHEGPYARTAYLPDAAHATRICAPKGSTWSADEFYCDVDAFEHSDKRAYHLYPGGPPKRFATSGGRSSEARAPFFRVSKDDTGYVLAVGWTGQWNFEISRETDAVRVRSGIEGLRFRLLPGEAFRTSSVVILPFRGDANAAQNLWRRLVKSDFSLIGRPGRPAEGPLCTGTWGGTPSAEILNRIDLMRQNGLPFEYLWIDAGWYGDTQPSGDEFIGDWAHHTGDWRVSPHTHPNGLTDVSEAVHRAGMKFLLWFEPERVRVEAPILREHPEYFLESGREGDKNRLLWLGDPAAWDYCYKTVSGLIRRLGVDCYRQDFNFAPLPYWRLGEAEDRQGVREILHVNGLYRFWDALLAEFPHLIIDNCASGGRRIDVETLRRSVPLWRSDYQCPANYPPEGSQCHMMSFNAWMPYSGTTAGRDPTDLYRVRSGYGACMTTNFFYCMDQEPEFRAAGRNEAVARVLEEYKRVRPYFTGDFYPLTELSDRTDVWCAVQFDRPEENDGVLLVFRRERAPYRTADLRLHVARPDAAYRFTDADGGEWTADGKDLAEKGLPLTVEKTRTAKIYFYRVTKKS